MKYKRKTEVLHETSQHISGQEPFLNFPRPWMIVSLNGHPRGTHNFFEGHFESMARLRSGDRLIFQMVRETLVPMSRWERFLDWWSK